jgi:hypothetical protein
VGQRHVEMRAVARQMREWLRHKGRDHTQIAATFLAMKRQKM